MNEWIRESIDNSPKYTKKKIAIQIARIEYYNKEGELAVYSDKPFSMYQDVTDLRDWSEENSSIEIIYEQISDAWIIRVMPRVKKEEMYALAKGEVRRELLFQSNRLGKKWKDKDGLIWYG